MSAVVLPLPCPVIAMIHLPALPGAPRHRMPLAEIADRAAKEAETAQFSGVDAVLMENFGDAPFFPDSVPPHTVAAMTAVALAVRKAIDIPLGLNVLRNDAHAALSIAAAVGASFIRVNIHCGARVTDQGLVTGKAAETLRLREQLQAEVAILADVAVKHSHPLGAEDLGSLARDTAYRGLADGLIVSGTGTGEPTNRETLATVRSAVPDRPLFVGSGVTAEDLGELLQIADGVIVGTSVKRGGVVANPLDQDRLTALVARAREATTS